MSLRPLDPLRPKIRLAHQIRPFLALTQIFELFLEHGRLRADHHITTVTSTSGMSRVYERAAIMVTRPK